MMGTLRLPTTGTNFLMSSRRRQCHRGASHGFSRRQERLPFRKLRLPVQVTHICAKHSKPDRFYILRVDYRESGGNAVDQPLQGRAARWPRVLPTDRQHLLERSTNVLSAQWGSNRVSGACLPKMGISVVAAGDFCRNDLQVSGFGS
jgi:hypothetical protein